MNEQGYFSWVFEGLKKFILNIFSNPQRREIEEGMCLLEEGLREVVVEGLGEENYT